MYEVSTWLYGWLLRLYPQAFRAQFASEMMQLFSEHCRQTRHPLRWLMLWSHTLVDVASSAVLEHQEELSRMQQTVALRWLVGVGCAGAAIIIALFAPAQKALGAIEPWMAQIALAFPLIVLLGALLPSMALRNMTAKDRSTLSLLWGAGVAVVVSYFVGEQVLFQVVAGVLLASALFRQGWRGQPQTLALLGIAITGLAYTAVNLLLAQPSCITGCTGLLSLNVITLVLAAVSWLGLGWLLIRPKASAVAVA